MNNTVDKIIPFFYFLTMRYTNELFKTKTNIVVNKIYYCKNFLVRAYG